EGFAFELVADSHPIAKGHRAFYSVAFCTTYNEPKMWCCSIRISVEDKIGFRSPIAMGGTSFGGVRTGQNVDGQLGTPYYIIKWRKEPFSGGQREEFVMVQYATVCDFWTTRNSSAFLPSSVHSTAESLAHETSCVLVMKAGLGMIYDISRCKGTGEISL
ncbi:hypothetical protein PILCRDRAFT_781831, partial [Piloderma croceum F 1598]